MPDEVEIMVGDLESLSQSNEAWPCATIAFQLIKESPSSMTLLVGRFLNNFSSVVNFFIGNDCL